MIQQEHTKVISALLASPHAGRQEPSRKIHLKRGGDGAQHIIIRKPLETTHHIPQLRNPSKEGVSAKIRRRLIGAHCSLGTKPLRAILRASKERENHHGSGLKEECKTNAPKQSSPGGVRHLAISARVLFNAEHAG